MLKKLYVIGLTVALIGWNMPPVMAYTNPDSVDITITVNNQISVNVQNGNFTHTTARNLADDFLLAQTEVLSIDNDSAADANGFIETYSLSASILAPASGWTLSSADATAGPNEMVILAVFSSAGSAQPVDTQYNTGGGTDDVVWTNSNPATTANYYGPTADSAKDGVSVSPATGAESNLWLRIKLPTTSTQAPGNAQFRLFVNATQG